MINSLTVVIPAFNEEDNIALIVTDCYQTLQNSTCSLEILVVDDGSTDRTVERVNELTKSIPNLVVYKHEINKGLGSAIRSGVVHARSEWLTWIPADGQFAASAINLAIDQAKESAFVLLRRDDSSRPFIRRLLSLFLYRSLQFGLGMRCDGYCGMYLVQARFIKSFCFSYSTLIQNYAIVLHCKQQNCQILTVDIELKERISGRSKMLSVKNLVCCLKELVRLKLNHL